MTFIFPPFWCYITKGLELSPVTVVGPGLRVVCDTFVKPGEDVIDCSTSYALHKAIVFQTVEYSMYSFCEVLA